VFPPRFTAPVSNNRSLVFLRMQASSSFVARAADSWEDAGRFSFLIQPFFLSCSLLAFLISFLGFCHLASGRAGVCFQKILGLLGIFFGFADGSGVHENGTRGGKDTESKLRRDHDLTRHIEPMKAMCTRGGGRYTLESNW
jgi:hypothetical protein